MKEKLDVNKANSLKMIIVLSPIIFFLWLIMSHGDRRKANRETLKGEAIALTTRVEHANRRTYLRYYFYVDKRILSRTSNRDHAPLGKFYRVRYDLNKPEDNIIFLKEELKPDSITLVKAGFTKTKHYLYDGGVTCKYIETDRWK